MVQNDPRTEVLQRVRELLEEIDDDALATTAKFVEEIAKKNPSTTAQVHPLRNIKE
jgi:hypothetical protein